MKPNNSIYWLLVAAMICIVAAAAIAQDTSNTSVTQGQATQEAQVEKGEVVYVSGNELVVKMENGEVRHVTVPDGATATVDGKQITIKDVQPGMVLQRTITTTTTPEVVTTVRTIHGKVWHVNPPKTVILTLPEGGNKTYNVPKDQKFMIDGQEKTVWDLKKGMKISATVLTEVPQTTVAQQREVSGKMPAPPPTPPAEGALLIETPAAAPTVAQAEPPATLPKTGSMVPLLGLLGVLSIAGSFGLKLFRVR
jgi:LPXTG-motif cell wall-anchored protein